jgi:hypothetical protein
MPRFFSSGAAMLMNRFYLALGLVLVVSAGAARAEDAALPAGCALASASFLSQPDQGDATINCSGLSEAFGQKFAEIMNRILQDRLDPQMVLAKLDEVDRVPEVDVARTFDEDQRQLMIKNLLGKPAEQIAITAHPMVEDSAEFAKAIATQLLMLGWQIEGHQIRRAAPKLLEPVRGVALVVRDRGAAPKKALLLKAALAAAHINASLVADPALPPEATLLWIGRRPQFSATELAK